MVKFFRTTPPNPPTPPRDGLQSHLVWLLYETPPLIDEAALLSALQAQCGNVDQIGDKNNLLIYVFPDYLSKLKDGQVPAQIVLTKQEPGAPEQDLEEAIQQSWGWSQARHVVSRCPVRLSLLDIMAFGLHYKDRLVLFHHALEAVLKVAPCQAIYWVESRQIINPADYLAARQSAEFHPLQFALNVRLLEIAGGRWRGKIMDTLGLNICGLPDLQCHFLDLDPDEIGWRLYHYAFYLYENGDIFQDGDTIDGIEPGSKWKCHRQISLVKPERLVIDINPGAP